SHWCSASSRRCSSCCWGQRRSRSWTPSPASDIIRLHVSRLRNVTIWHVALLLPWVVAAASLRRKFNDNSYLWHVRAGDLQAAEGAVITADPFSFTRNGSPWRTQSWLAELFYSRL